MCTPIFLAFGLTWEISLEVNPKYRAHPPAPVTFQSLSACPNQSCALIPSAVQFPFQANPLNPVSGDLNMSALQAISQIPPVPHSVPSVPIPSVALGLNSSTVPVDTSSSSSVPSIPSNAVQNVPAAIHEQKEDEPTGYLGLR
jgi:hypothetical protein